MEELLKKWIPPDKPKGRKFNSGKSDVDVGHGGCSSASAGGEAGSKRALEDSYESDSSSDFRQCKCNTKRYLHHK